MAGLTEGVAASKRGLALLLEQVSTEKTARAALREHRAARERGRSSLRQAELGHHGRHGSRAAQLLTGFEPAACLSRRGRHVRKQCGRLVSSRVALRNEVACRVSPTSMPPGWQARGRREGGRQPRWPQPMVSRAGRRPLVQVAHQLARAGAGLCRVAPCFARAGDTVCLVAPHFARAGDIVCLVARRIARPGEGLCRVTPGFARAGLGLCRVAPHFARAGAGLCQVAPGFARNPDRFSGR
jgi:hypothetical protein